ncbi:MMPL family transporter [Myxococcota bacterium]|nr:MMPL family transporter [Myxococcota bacterium]
MSRYFNKASIQNLIDRLISIPIQHPKAVLLASIPVFLAALWLSSSLTMNSRMDAMLPADTPAMRAQVEFDRAFDAQDQALLVVQCGDPAQARAYLDAAAAKIAAAGIAHRVLYRVNLPGSGEPRHLESDGGGTWMMVISPRIDPARYAESAQEFLGALEGVTAALAADPRFDGISAGITGGAFIQDVEGDRRAMGNLMVSAVVTLVLVLAFIVLAFGRVLLPLAMILPLLLGVVLTTAFASLAYGSLNMFSMGFAALLFGLGIDFAVHLLNRFQEEAARLPAGPGGPAGPGPGGRATTDALLAAMRRSGTGILFGALTTALAFYAFLPARFAAFAQIGGLSGTGILLMCLSMLVLVPAIIAVSRTQAEKSVRNQQWTPLRRLAAGVVRFRVACIVLAVVATVALVPVVMQVHFNRDVSQIYPDDLNSLRWLKVVEKEFGQSPNTLTFRVKDLARLRRVTADLSKRPDVREIQSILSWLPPAAAKSDLTAALALSLMPAELAGMYIGRDGSYRVELVPAVDIWDPASYARLQKAITDATGQGPVGMPALMADIAALIEADILMICAACLGLSFLLLLLIFRALRPAAVALAPVTLALWFTLGLMPLLGIQLNIFSIMAFPLIIGIGIDSGIHLVHRLKAGAAASAADDIMHTGKAIIITTVTTVIGFGSLLTINHPGMQSLGATVSLGLLLCLLFTLVLIPALGTTRRCKLQH